ncbi:hypothetical protein ACE1ET_07165 [Saccharicrinis sp. FJH62]|uniref:hypothetical protein n=1 Tax=Saccharicrinis sp. FJH62 TaxID=3344657 RepID=UPI0035D4AE41
MNIITKIRKKIWSKIVSFTKFKPYYKLIYCSYWHSVFHSKGNNPNNYFSAVPNQGAGIGHQMANWIAGYWFAKQFSLSFAHIPFSSDKWEKFLGFSENEVQVSDLLKKGFKKIRLPLFDENNTTHLDMIKAIISSYQNKKAVFVCEQDQFYARQFEIINDIQYKFYHATSRKDDRLIFKKDNFNIAIHVRRGDIVKGMNKGIENHKMRWQTTDYFYKILDMTLSSLKSKRPIHVYLFSQGDENEFKEFQSIKNIHFCLEMSATDSFLHMVYADLLITSKSSFSYKPALLSNGIKICPENFWHGYPESDSWILANDYGEFNSDQLNKILN